MICLSFDIEEFDLPLEHGHELPLERQIEISRTGALRILDLLKRRGVRATFFITVRFARHAPDVIKRIVTEGHEVASHGMEHSRFELSHLKESRLELEAITGRKVHGYRMARMMKTPPSAIAEAGYLYDTSLNPTFIPGRYMHLHKPRKPFMVDGIMEIPTSVTPLVRFPLFWLASHVLPPRIYRTLAARTLSHDGFLAIYFHPWEFYDLKSIKSEMALSAMICARSGSEHVNNLEAFIAHFQAQGQQFGTYFDLYARHLKP